MMEYEHFVFHLKQRQIMLNCSVLAPEHAALHAGKHGGLQSRDRFHPPCRDVHSGSIHAALTARIWQQGRRELCLDEHVVIFSIGCIFFRCVSKVRVSSRHITTTKDPSMQCALP